MRSRQTTWSAGLLAIAILGLVVFYPLLAYLIALTLVVGFIGVRLKRPLALGFWVVLAAYVVLQSLFGLFR